MDAAVDLEATMLDASSLHYWWPDIERLLDGNEEHWTPWYTKEGILQQALEGRLQIWMFGTKSTWDLVVFTTITNMTAGRVLYIPFVAGKNLRRYLPLVVATMGNFGIMQGCVRGEMVGRRGWERILARYGAKFIGIMMSLPAPAKARH